MEYKKEFVNELNEEGWIQIIINEEYGGEGLKIQEEEEVMEEIKKQG